MQLLGADGACRYYLSRLNEVDYFAAWSDQFAHALSEFAVLHFGPSAARLCQDLGAPMILVGFLRRTFTSHCTGASVTRISKEERAIELLLRHPDWSDAWIAKEVGTTVKQLARWSDFKYARVLERRLKVE